MISVPELETRIDQIFAGIVIVDSGEEKCYLEDKWWWTGVEVQTSVCEPTYRRWMDEEAELNKRSYDQWVAETFTPEARTYLGEE